MLWIGSGQGIFKYDPYKEIFTVIDIALYNSISHISVDGQNNIWFLADGTLYGYNQKTKKVINSKLHASCLSFDGKINKIHLALNAETAQKILEKEVINLIISDIMMPGIDGFELCRIVKSNVEYCHIPIVLLTSKNTYQSHIEGLEVGADAYIQKPFSSDLLLVQIANLLKNRINIKAHFEHSPFEDMKVIANSKLDENFLKKLDNYIHRNIKDPNFDVDQVAEHMNMSRPTFYRKIKSISSLSPKELIDITKFKMAARLIAQNQYTLFEVSKMIGYSTQSLFNRNFHKHFKVSPMEYIQSLNKKSTK